MMAGNEPKLADTQSLREFPLLRPIVRGEIGGMSTRPSLAQASLAHNMVAEDFAASVFASPLHDPALLHVFSDFQLSKFDMQKIQESVGHGGEKSIFGVGGVKPSSVVASGIGGALT